MNCHVICCRRGSLGSQTVYHTSKSLDITELPVRKGDTLDFVADFNGEISFDQHHWAIRIETVEEPKTAWDSVREFQGQESDRFQVFAHALLMTNEFVFVD